MVPLDFYIGKLHFMSMTDFFIRGILLPAIGVAVLLILIKTISDFKSVSGEEENEALSHEKAKEELIPIRPIEETKTINFSVKK